MGLSEPTSSIGVLQPQLFVLAATVGVCLYTLWQTWTNSGSSSSSSKGTQTPSIGGSSSSNHEVIDGARTSAPHPTEHKQNTCCSLHSGSGQQSQADKLTAREGTPTAAAAAAADAARLASVYVSLAGAFRQQGLDLTAVADTAYWFDTDSDPVVPMFYQDPAFPPSPLPPAAVRLLLVMLSEAVPQTAAAAAAAGPAGAAAAPAAISSKRDVVALNSQAVAAAVSVIDQVRAWLPQGCKVFANPAHGLHITLFHFSHPADTRPDTLHPTGGCCDSSTSSGSGGDGGGGGGGGSSSGSGASARSELHLGVSKPAQKLQNALVYQIAADATAAAQTAAAGSGYQQQQQQQQRSVLSLPAHLRPGPTEQQQAAERAAAARLATQLQPFTLQLERVFMTRTGTLLIGWIDCTGRVAALRQQLHATFPSASSKQSNIIHTSLLRIVQTPPQQQRQQQQQQQLSLAVVSVLSDLCERLTQQYRGVQLHVEQLQWVVEEQFSTVQGTQVPMPLASV